MNNIETAPDFSVVIASWSGEALLSRCLESVLAQRNEAEVIVATNGPDAVTEVLKQRHPEVCFLSGPRNATVFDLRSLGVRRARGKMIALLEDHTTVAPRWVESLRAAHARGCRIAGGPVENGLTERAFDEALYLCEYGIYMPGQPAGRTAMLSGINVAYDGALLAGCREVWETAFYETNVHAALQAEGIEMHLVPDAWVLSHLPMRCAESVKHLFQGGRYFGRFRMAHASATGRVFWKLAWPAVPLILGARLFRIEAARCPGRLWSFFRALPYLVLLLGAWGAGEGAGSLWPGKEEDHAHRD